MKKYLSVIMMCACALAVMYGAEVQRNLSGSLVRMHVIANSNSAYDQRVKITIRDSVLDEFRAGGDLHTAEDAANEVLARIGAGYTARIVTERCYVPVKTYKNISLPEGFYNSVRVVLGAGTGENWWCVAYPPLCYTEEMFGAVSEEGMSQLEIALDDEALKAVVNSGGVNFRFKIVEKVQELRRKITE